MKINHQSRHYRFYQFCGGVLGRFFCEYENIPAVTNLCQYLRRLVSWPFMILLLGPLAWFTDSMASLGLMFWGPIARLINRGQPVNGKVVLGEFWGLVCLALFGVICWMDFRAAALLLGVVLVVVVCLVLLFIVVGFLAILSAILLERFETRSLVMAYLSAKLKSKCPRIEIY